MYTLGIDIGSASSKAVILRDDGEVAGQAVIPVGTGTTGPERALREAFAQAGIAPEDVGRTIVTGYGRVTWQGADRQVSEITCHARGVLHRMPEARTIIDIGGQDVKAIEVDPDRGFVRNFVMNDKCAAGTGRFLEVMARVLGLEVEGLAEVSETSARTVSISSICTVFAESEVISHLSRGEAVPDVLAGIHQSVAKRVAGLVSRLGVRPPVVLTGGVAKNRGVVRALEKELKTEIRIAHSCQLTGALGAALLAREDLSKI
ncbi:MAG: 2-hydroxyglutaryl-CoA dehydratase [Deltaproteobacteria bacterium HGW-Deltaproteobacteria-19]|jgi:predicted CoA-substrate-specific enzyme activase|nr:MAG: 2-hydroxyglutaryl-CoA dehydratase [Deltaproteobacteria bacterium HGW-Deltaproteobacteria-19]